MTARPARAQAPGRAEKSATTLMCQRLLALSYCVASAEIARGPPATHNGHIIGRPCRPIIAAVLIASAVTRNMSAPYPPRDKTPPPAQKDNQSSCGPLQLPSAGLREGVTP